MRTSKEGAFGTVGGPGDTQFPPSCQLSARPSMHKASVLSIGPGTQKGKLGTKGTSLVLSFTLLWLYSRSLLFQVKKYSAKFTVQLLTPRNAAEVIHVKLKLHLN